jgi:hypothetical protein
LRVAAIVFVHQQFLSEGSAPLHLGPNAGAHLLPEAGARDERTLEAVRCSAWLGVWDGRDTGCTRLPHDPGASHCLDLHCRSPYPFSSFLSSLVVYPTAADNSDGLKTR